MMKTIATMALGSYLLFAGAAASAAPVYWTDWTSNTANTANGVINAGSSNVDVVASSTSNFNFVLTSGGASYWNPSTPYTSGDIDNAPDTSDIISLNIGGTVTIDFSAPVLDPLIALVSWNGNTLVFNAPIEIVSYGTGYWGGGTPLLNANADGIYGGGEVHGVIRIKGTFDSISFTHTSENWHGFTVGITAAVPEPENFALLLAGLPLLLAARRKMA